MNPTAPECAANPTNGIPPMAQQQEFNDIYKMLLDYDDQQARLSEIPRGRRAAAAITNRNKAVLRILDRLNPEPIQIIVKSEEPVTEGTDE